MNRVMAAVGLFRIFLGGLVNASPLVGGASDLLSKTRRLCKSASEETRNQDETIHGHF